MENKLNIMQKIQKVKRMIIEKGVGQSGNNTFSHYKYSELSDISPMINTFCEEVGLYPEFKYDHKNKEMRLYIFDCDNMMNSRSWETNVVVSPLKGCNEMQSIGGAQTYARRYLYYLAFDIVVCDPLDSGMVDEKELEASKPVTINQIREIETLAKSTNTTKKSLLAYYKVNDLKELNNRDAESCIDNLIKKKVDLEKKEYERIKAEKEAKKNNTPPIN